MMKAIPLWFAASVMTVALVALLGVQPAHAGFGQSYVELSRPQSDDIGHYVPVFSQQPYPIVGFIASGAPVTQVMVNDVPADLFSTEYRPMGAPAGWGVVGFRAEVLLDEASEVIVAALGDGGLDTRAVFAPDRQATLDRLQVLRLQQTRDNEYLYDLRFANYYACQDDYVHAYPLYRHCLGLRATFAFGDYCWGLCYFDDDDWDLAFTHFRRCVDIEPGFFIPHYDLGRCYERRGRWDDAGREYQTCIGRRSNFAPAHWRLGETLAHRSRWDEAAAQYYRAVDVNPRFAPAHRSLGIALDAQGRHDEAANEFNRAVTFNPRDAQSYRALGDAKAHQGNWGEAEQRYRQSLHTDPSQGEAHRGMAQVEYNKGQYYKAWDQIHAARGSGATVPNDFVNKLQQRMPEPRYTAPAAGGSYSPRSSGSLSQGGRSYDGGSSQGGRSYGGGGGSRGDGGGGGRGGGGRR